MLMSIAVSWVRPCLEVPSNQKQNSPAWRGFSCLGHQIKFHVT